VCGACLSPGALELLGTAGLGDVVPAHGGVPLERLVLRVGGGAAPVRLAGSVALSRATLDHALVRAAQAAGAHFFPSARASLVGGDRDARVLRVDCDGSSREVRARAVVDATGLGGGMASATEGGPVAGGSGAAQAARRSRVGLGAVLAAQGYPVEPGDLHMAVGTDGYVGLVRVEDGALNVAAAVDPTALGRTSPGDLVSRLLVGAGMPPLGEAPRLGWRGTPRLTRWSPAVGAERLFRVGDAAGYVEPFTGEGIGWALGAGAFAASLAARAAERWSDDLLDEWLAYHRGTLVPSQRLCRVLAGALRRPWLVNAGAAALRIAPGLAAPFVGWAARPPAEAVA
jgi:flavin-dependent dehydrogenase